ncbi:MAG: ferritin family protein [Anaerolineae bacterium]|nr:ferritin family protein [Anaerolineae bacterium]
MTESLGIEEALNIAMEAELKAQAFYAQAAAWVQDPRGRDLLSRLAAFEQHHYQKLAELLQSLQLGGQFIAYEPAAVDQFAPLAAGEGAAALPEGLAGEADILSHAIQIEQAAGERYRVLADDTGDPAGRAMFRRLADEELVHQRILEDEFFSLSNQGVWGWSGMYGE